LSYISLFILVKRYIHQVFEKYVISVNSVHLYDLFLNQVIFHAVEQLKMLQAEEISQTESTTSSSISTTQSKQLTQPSQSTTPEGIFIISTATTAKVHNEKTETPKTSISILTSEVSNQGSSKIYDDPTEVLRRLAASSINYARTITLIKKTA